jgi:hypothetical protein
MNFASVVRTSIATRTAEMRVAQYDWCALSEELSGYGCVQSSKMVHAALLLLMLEAVITTDLVSPSA